MTTDSLFENLSLPIPPRSPFEDLSLPVTTDSPFEDRSLPTTDSLFESLSLPIPASTHALTAGPLCACGATNVHDGHEPADGQTWCAACPDVVLDEHGCVNHACDATGIDHEPYCVQTVM